MCTINKDHMIYSFWDITHNGQSFLSFWAIFHPLTFLTTQKFKILKKWKNAWRYHFTLVYQKWQSYDVWFLRHWVQQTEFFVILGYFLPFHPIIKPEKLKFWKNEKKCLEISFYTHVQQMTIIWCMVPELWSTKDRIFCHFGLFFALLTL